MQHQLKALLAAALLSSCVSSYGGTASSSSAFLLSEHTTDEGVQTKLRVHGDRDSGASLLRVETREEEVPFLGLSTRSLNRAYAESIGVTPWRGVRVSSVTEGSGAAAAGLRTGDILLTLAGQELASTEAFQETVVLLLQPGTPVPAVLLRANPSGARVEEAVTVTPGSRMIENSTTEQMKLDAPEEIVRRTGMQVATLEAEIARDCGFGDQSIALVTTVVAGAAAYDGGIRSGDRILECNGEPVTSAAEVLAAIKTNETLALLVEGDLGVHRAGIGTGKDIDSRSRFHVPILIDHKTRVDRTRTSFLDFIFQFGFNYRRTAVDSDTREPHEETYLSILPLGMFQFERSPTHSKNTLFWFITWSSRR
tara:strand:- start:1513 stop:2613 length:1101 start_codon:yes stop_codon:yes gene_type:complete